MTNAGVKYGLKQALGIAWVRINKLLGKLIQNPFADGRKSWICSELVAAILVDVVKEDLTEDVTKYLESAGPRQIKEMLDTFHRARQIL